MRRANRLYHSIFGYGFEMPEGYDAVVEVSGHQHHRYYAYDSTQALARGSFGQVYKAFPVVKNPDTGKKEVDRNKPFALKRIALGKHKSSWDEVQQECKITNYYYETEPPVNEGDYAYIITEFWSGKPGYTIWPYKKAQLSEAVQPLNFYQRIQLLFHMSQSLHWAHQNTLQKPAHVHRDLKGNNILIDVVDKKRVVPVEKKEEQTFKQINNVIIDWGLSAKAGLSEEERKKIGTGGTIAYCPPEIFAPTNSIAPENDVYSMAAIFLIFLNADSPFTQKDDWRYKEAAEKSYDFSNLFDNLTIPDFIVGAEADSIVDIKPILRAFLKRMASQELTTRATSDEVLRFFTTLNNLCCIYQEYEQTKETELIKQQAIACAQLALLANGVWYTDLSELSPRKALTFEHFQWERELTFCHSVTHAFQQDQLNETELDNLLYKTTQANRVKSFNYEKRCAHLVEVIAKGTDELSDAAEQDDMDIDQWAQAAEPLMKLAEEHKHKKAICYISRMCPDVAMTKETEQALNKEGYLRIPTDNTSIYYQAYHGTLQVDRLTPEQIQHQDATGLSLMDYAAAGGQLLVMMALCQNGLTYDQENDVGVTVDVYAEYYGQHRAHRFILEEKKALQEECKIKTRINKMFAGKVQTQSHWGVKSIFSDKIRADETQAAIAIPQGMSTAYSLYKTAKAKTQNANTAQQRLAIWQQLERDIIRTFAEKQRETKKVEQGFFSRSCHTLFGTRSKQTKVFYQEQAQDSGYRKQLGEIQNYIFDEATFTQSESKALVTITFPRKKATKCTEKKSVPQAIKQILEIIQDAEDLRISWFAAWEQVQQLAQAEQAKLSGQVSDKKSSSETELSSDEELSTAYAKIEELGAQIQPMVLAS